MSESKDPSKTNYFQGKTTSHLTEMRQAKKAGLFPKKEGWRNVVEHMVVEAEAVDVLAEALGLSESERKKLYTAALLHDVCKRREKEIATEKGASGYDESARLQAEWIRSLGYSDDIVEMTESTGHSSLVRFQDLDKIPLLQKIIHYVDDITQGNDLVPLDQRIDDLETNPRYKEINQKGVEVLGRPYFVAQRETSKKIEKEFAEKIGLEDPIQLPLWIRDRIFERIEASDSLEKITKIGIDALQKAFAVHNLLGEKGLETVAKNQFGDTALRGDIECEEAVLNVLENNGLPIVVHSEEHDIKQIGDKPKYLAVLDGIDGSSVYKDKFGKGRYATMFGIFSGTNPEYRDYLFSGIMEHASGRLFYAVKDKGAFVLENGQTKPIHCRDTKELDPEKVKIIADSDFDKIFQLDVVGTVTKHLPEFNIETLHATAAHHSSLVNGEVDAVIECTRKGNLEIATSFGLITEAGGAMVTLDGVSLGNKKYLEFGQGQTVHIPIISSATDTLARNLADRVSR